MIASDEPGPGGLRSDNLQTSQTGWAAAAQIPPSSSLPNSSDGGEPRQSSQSQRAPARQWVQRAAGQEVPGDAGEAERGGVEGGVEQCPVPGDQETRHRAGLDGQVQRQPGKR